MERPHRQFSDSRHNALLEYCYLCRAKYNVNLVPDLFMGRFFIGWNNASLCSLLLSNS